MEVIVYTRVNCKLCDEAILYLKQKKNEYNFKLRLIDIDLLDDRKGYYLDKIPLIYLNGREEFRFKIDPDKFSKLIEKHGLSRTKIIAKRYSRFSYFYDLSEIPIELAFFRHWRPELMNHIRGRQILEVGAGTGKNFKYYPDCLQVKAIDISFSMLKKARIRKMKAKPDISLAVMDAENLAFEDNTFDTIISTYVFCSVPNPVSGLQELKRVCKPKGRIIFLEHVLSSQPFMSKMMELFNPITVGLFGFNMNRRTVENIEIAGLTIIEERNLRSDIFKLIVAIP